MSTLYLLNLVGGVVLEQDGLVLLLGGEDDTIDSLDANRGSPTGHGLQGVLDLDQLARGAEGGQRKAVSLRSHG